MATVVLEATLVLGLGLAVDGLSGWAPGHLGFIFALPGLSEAWEGAFPTHWTFLSWQLRSRMGQWRGRG